MCRPLVCLRRWAILDFIHAMNVGVRDSVTADEADAWLLAGLVSLGL